jgi:predicted lipoprotein with Yx(FWY)xxD motif
VKINEPIFQLIILVLIPVISLSLILSACSPSSSTTPAKATPSSAATTTPPISSKPASPPPSQAPSTTPPSTSKPPSSSPTNSPTPTSPPSTTASTPPSPPTTAAVAFNLNVSSKTGIGNYLVDSKGMTLYYFAKDVNGKSNASGPVIQTWPVFSAPAYMVPSPLTAADFKSITRTDGLSQTTYKGWPLYYYANDKTPGDTLGDGIGGLWFVVKVPFYTIMLQSRTDFGLYLVDVKGMTLYYNINDSAGKGNVTGDALITWPIFNASQLIFPSSFKADDFGSITRSDGQVQTTYKGFPLYYYVGDKVLGDATGNGIGGVWFVVSIANFPRTPTPTQAPSYGGGGY